MRQDKGESGLEPRWISETERGRQNRLNLMKGKKKRNDLEEIHRIFSNWNQEILDK